MATLPKGWRRLHGRDPEAELHGLQQRFRKISRRYHRGQRLGRLYQWARLAGLFFIAAIAAYFLLTVLSPWPPVLTLRHLASFPNCAAARTVGLARALRGGPGYWPRHDRDNDGKACELPN